jgi:hypothetical protein
MPLEQAKLDSVLATDSAETFIIHGPLVFAKALASGLCLHQNVNFYRV